MKLRVLLPLITAVALFAVAAHAQSKSARQVDEFGGVVPSEINAKLDNFFTELEKDPTATGYIVAYPARSAPSSGSAFLTRATADARQRGIDTSRIKTIEGAARPVMLIQLWFVPEGATVPKFPPGKPQALTKTGAHKPQ